MYRSMIRFLRHFAALGLALLAQGGAALAQNGALPDTERHVQASFIPERAGVAPGGTVTVALHEIIRKNWHTYWINPGDAGAPTTIEWRLPQGWTASPIQWPYPIALPVKAGGVTLMDFGYEDQVALLTDITAPKDAKPGDSVTLKAQVMWLVCSDVCIPEGPFDLSLTLPVTAAPVAADANNAALFAETRAKLPHASPWKAKFDVGDKRFALLVQSPELAVAKPKEAVFYPYTNGQLDGATPQKAGIAADGLVIEATPGFKLATPEKRAGVDKLGGVLVLTGADGRTDALEIEAQPGPVPQSAVLLDSGESDIGLLSALLFAFLGGLILNLMPCVFPVLSMKALALAAKRDHPAAAKASALAYGAGAIVSFAGLALILVTLKGAGSGLGWGFQLQQPLFVAVLALLMFAVGLNLFGLYEIGGRFAGAGENLSRREGATGSFFTGVLAVVVATPCTAPFMGAAMGFALAQNTAVALAIFVALGAGFAAPFVLLGFSPGALKVLPRPGTWMSTLRQVLAFPMFGAAIWLFWVLSFQTDSNGLLAVLSSALALAFALWVYGRTQSASGNRRLAGLALASVAFIAAAAILPQAGQVVRAAPQTAVTASADTLGYEPYTAAKLASLRAEGRPVFVNATAAWCITCLVNEKVALSGEKLKTAFAERKVAALKADWTNEDRDISALLSAQGRSGVPLYLYFAPGAEKPVILPQLLTESTVLAELDRPH